MIAGHHLANSSGITKGIVLLKDTIEIGTIIMTILAVDRIAIVLIIEIIPVVGHTVIALIIIVEAVDNTVIMPTS